MIKNYIFDVDRTLVNSYLPELETLKEALLISTGKNYSDEVMNKLTILTTDEFFKSLGIDVYSTLMSEINHNWGVLLDKRKIDFFDGVKELLYYLKNEGYFLGIATSRDMDELHELSDIIECLDLFDYVVTSDMVKYPKPNPESINMIIDKYNLDITKSIMIGNDSISDIAGAKSVGLDTFYIHSNISPKLPEETVALPDGTGKKRKIMPDADFVLDGMDMERVREMLLGE